MNRIPWVRVAHAFRRVALPLASYYVVTLALPLANGAALSGAFMEHALVVLIVPPVAIMLACAAYTIAHALASRAFQMSRAAHLLVLDQARVADGVDHPYRPSVWVASVTDTDVLRL
jgi:hypothetical protein